MMYMDTADEWMEDVQRMEGAWFDDRWRVGGGYPDSGLRINRWMDKQTEHGQSMNRDWTMVRCRMDVEDIYWG
jgi:hypothetical protein